MESVMVNIRDCYKKKWLTLEIALSVTASKSRNLMTTETYEGPDTMTKSALEKKSAVPSLRESLVYILVL